MRHALNTLIMPSVDVFNEHVPATGNGAANGNGPVTDTFDSEILDSANGHLGNDVNSSDSDDPHGVVEINHETRSRAGTNGSRRPHTPQGSMALTDYSVNPSTPSAEKRQRIRDLVPEDYLLPNGHPDVRTTRLSICENQS